LGFGTVLDEPIDAMVERPPPMIRFTPFEEVVLDSHLETDASTPSPQTPSIRKDALIALARRHPATTALIEEITAEVTARTESRLRIATAELRERRLWQIPIADRALVLFGAFVSVNLLLVTLVLALAHAMPAWLAALVVSSATAGGTALFALRRSSEAAARLRWLRVPLLRKLAVRKFAARLFAGT
jgi:hypothetical protein